MKVQNKNIDYIQIVKDAWMITWKNKFLWWFGFFVALGGGGMFSFNSTFSGENEEVSQEVVDNVGYYWSLYSEWIIAGIVVVFMIVIILYCLSIIGKGGLISSLLKINKNIETNFSLGFKDGKKFFWKLFFLNIILGVSLFLATMILAFPIVRLILLEVYGPAIILGIVAVPIIISIFILVAFLKIYAQIYLVGSGVGIIESIKLSYNILKKNMKDSFLMGIALIIIKMITAIIILMTLFLLLVVFLVIGAVTFAFAEGVGVMIMITIGLLVLLMISIAWNSIYIVFMQSSWILFFNKIATPSIEVVGEFNKKTDSTLELARNQKLIK